MGYGYSCYATPDLSSPPYDRCILGLQGGLDDLGISTGCWFLVFWGILRILWHHRPRAVQSSSPLPSSKDIPFLTLVAELHFSLALVRYAEKCGSKRFTGAGRLREVAGPGLTIALSFSFPDCGKTWSGWKSLRYHHNMRHFTAGYGYHYLDLLSTPGHSTCHYTYPYHRLPFIIVVISLGFCTMWTYGFRMEPRSA